MNILHYKFISTYLLTGSLDGFEQKFVSFSLLKETNFCSNLSKEPVNRRVK